MASNEQQHYHQLWQDDIPTQALHALDVCGVDNTFVPTSDGLAARVRPGGSY